MSNNNKKLTKFKNANNISKKISQLMLDKKAIEIKIIDVRKITTLTDFFVLCTSESTPQTKAISDHIYKQLKKDKIKAWHIEGYENLDWVLLDYINVVVHIFSKKSSYKFG